MTVFKFGNTNIASFDEHKRMFSFKFFNGQDINHNTVDLKSGGHIVQLQAFTTKLGKTVDFHEDVIKQMYIQHLNSERKLDAFSNTFSIFTSRQAVLEQRLQKVEDENKVLREQVEFLMIEDKKREDKDKHDKLKERHDALMKEIREIENDMKFYEKVDDESY